MAAVCHVEFRIVDEDGVRVPNAGAEVKFDMDVTAKIIGLGNGDFAQQRKSPRRPHRAFHGRGLAILQTTTQPPAALLCARRLPALNPPM
jgi:hypothetical protein